jgi:hypothetical protein
MHGKSFLAASLCGWNEKQQCFCKGRSLSSRDKEPACPLNQGALNTYSRDSFQPSPCLQATLRSEIRAKLFLATRLTQIQATALKRNKNEGMLVCIVQGATVLISRREKLNSIVLDFFAP